MNRLERERKKNRERERKNTETEKREKQATRKIYLVIANHKYKFQMWGRVVLIQV